MRHLSEGRVTIRGLSKAADTVNLVDALHSDSVVIDLGEGGTTARFYMAVAALSSDPKILTGSERLKERPMAPLINALRALGSKIECTEEEGFLPLKIERANLKGGEVEIDATISSQFITALMMIGPVLPGGLVIRFLGKTVSDPYIELTLAMMKKIGVRVGRSGNQILVEESGYSAGEIAVEGDWTAASYFYAAVALNQKLKVNLPGLMRDSSQGDAVLPELYSNLGVKTDFGDNAVVLSPSGRFAPPKHIDFTAFPDLAQTLAVTYAGLGLSLNLTGLQTLKAKETDRIEALSKTLKLLDVDTESGADSLKIFKSGALPSNLSIPTFGDHRMAMSFAPLAFKVDLSIENPRVVDKSFPDFFEEFGKLGVEMS